jgi:uncharacterized protein (DUF1810 family)
MSDLERFVVAQESRYEQALAEIRRGRKDSHWMWYIFPQLAGLGFSPTAERYAIRDLDEARAYLAHPVLGPRLIACATAVAESSSPSADHLFGFPDELKLCSSMTLFSQAAPDQPVFTAVLTKYYDGKPDPRTITLLASQTPTAR